MPPTAIRTRPPPVPSSVLTSGGNEQRDEVALALLITELADESDVELVECVTAATRSGCAGSGSRGRFRFLVAMFGNAQ